ncbi:MAG: carboxypeptidase-like regulatory domain-containing protein, partial [Armatimonadota bacterium]
MRLRLWTISAFTVALAFLLFGCGQEDISCLNPNTLSGFVYVRQGAFEETDRTLDDDVLVSDKFQPPAGFLPFKGAKVKVEETGASLELGERGSFVFHPLPAGTYTIVIEFEGFPPVRRTKDVCVVTLPSYYYRPPYYDPSPVFAPSPPKPSPQP